MGLMDKLKAAKSNLTGDWATVTLQAEPVTRGGTLQLSSTVTVKSNDISVEKVLFEVRCEEIVELNNVHCSEYGSGSQTFQGNASATESVFDKETSVASAVQLAAGSTSTYTGEIAIPASAPPAFDGRNARYEWQARARLDMKGNDPDSGWQRIDVA
jgi:hypothetical protein